MVKVLVFIFLGIGCFLFLVFCIILFRCFLGKYFIIMIMYIEDFLKKILILIE